VSKNTNATHNMVESGDVFEDCSVCILRSKDLSPQAADLVSSALGTLDSLDSLLIYSWQLAGIIKDGGGNVVDVKADRTIPLLELDYIVSETIDFSQYTEARDAMITVVKSSWVQESFRRKKLAQIKAHSPDPRLFFSGVNFAFGENIPELDRLAILGPALGMGGQSSENLTRMVTHLVALSMDDIVCKHAIEKGLKCKIVLPHWYATL